MTEKKPYSTPTLTRWGALKDLTRSGTGILGDSLLAGQSGGGGTSGSTR